MFVSPNYQIIIIIIIICIYHLYAGYLQLQFMVLVLLFPMLTRSLPGI